jgi:hypothetical protein
MYVNTCYFARHRSLLAEKRRSVREKTTHTSHVTHPPPERDGITQIGLKRALWTKFNEGLNLSQSEYVSLPFPPDRS